MTDDHNDMHEDDHDGETVIAGDAVHEAPSDYEFTDDHGTPPSDPVDDHGALSGDAGDAAPSRRRSLLPILAAVGGVLVLGGVAWWQFGGASSSDTAFMPTTAPVTAASVPAPVPPAATPVEPAQASLAPAAPPVAPTTDSMAATPPAPVAAPVAPSQSAVATALPTPVAPNPVPDLKPADAVTAALPPKAVAPAPVPMPMPAPVIVATPVATPVLVTPSPNGGPNIQLLANRMDVLQKDVEHLTAQLSQMTNALAASATPPAGNQDIQHRLDALEQKINNLHHTDTAPAPMRTSLPTALVGAEEKPVTHHGVKHKPHIAKIVQVKIHHPIHLAATSAPQPLVAPQEKWVLRSATPDQAWVSDSNTSRDLKQVKVGDTLPTIGRVTAIHQNGDEWVVQGTKGTIQ